MLTAKSLPQPPWLMTGVMYLPPLIVRQSRDSGNDTDLFTIDSFFGFGLANLDTNQKEPDFTLSVGFL